MKIASIFFVLTLLFVAVVVSCGSGESKLIGKWSEVTTNGRDIIEFSKDKTCTIGGFIKGKWSVEDGGRIKIEYTTMGTNLVWTGNFEDELLVLDTPMGRGKFKKVK
jgi:hypothetical protein